MATERKRLLVIVLLIAALTSAGVGYIAWQLQRLYDSSWVIGCMSEGLSGAQCRAALKAWKKQGGGDA